ncbi:hypothetical protein L873DRAFT_1844734 [Choiromyces venosus 120613-1]|uniref:CFEM domain-containing protein n=1 Tax=Choiromyces venosus 120613-1 TaxID=1336337 RepID=A0A3N4JH18_9PEZI|nr:hypothetical protein L873DRAFT_1844734 [Choiromyces venosus 120613-1]
MQFSSVTFVLLTLFSTLVSSQAGPDIRNLPRCAAECAINALASVSGCKMNDYPCICRDQKFIQTIGVCIQKSCNGEDLKKAGTFAQEICGTDIATGTSASEPGPSADLTVTVSTTASSGTATTTVAKTSSATGTPNMAPTFTPAGGLIMGAGIALLLAV